ncbi:MAG: tetratricopeptide repeat protein [Proteobacteria bacterium]|nr:tetratricopeptide repeat protein [Pseudomonadota bacterium]
MSKAVAKSLKAANDALQAKNYDEVIAKTREAAAITPRTAYDDYIIHYLQMPAFAAKGNYTETATAIEAIIDSPYLPAALKPQLLRTLMTIDYQNKDYDKAIGYGQRALAAGDLNADTPLTIAQAYYLSNKYKEALAGMEAIVAKDEQAGRKPSEKSLQLVWSCALKLKDDAAAARAVEKLILFYPKPDYWRNAMAAILANKSNDDRLTLMTYRLMYQVGILTRGSDFTEMAQIALDQGNPGEAQTVLEQAFAKNLYTDVHDKERSQRLLDKIKRSAANDRASLPKSEKDAAASATGDGLVQVGAAYLGFGQPDKALAAISAGIAKGNLKFADESYMLLGIAYQRNKNTAEAVKAFNRATNDPKYARIAKLWALEARS